MIILREEIINFWGQELVKFKEKSLEKLYVSNETKDFLVNVGLPKREILLINFYSEDEIVNFTERNDNFVIIGDDFGTQICINEKSSQIYSIDAQKEYPIRFINSNIESLLMFLLLYIVEQPNLVGSSDEEAYEIVKKLRAEFKRIDSKAINKEENWWSVILEQTEQGLI